MIDAANRRRTIPLVDLRAQNSSLDPDIREAIAGVLGRGDFILGEELRLFEREFAEYCRVAHAVGVGSGSDALQLACRALELGEGDEVIIPAMTFAATAFAVSLCGAQPVLVDVRAADGLIDPAQIEAAVTPRTRAIIPVHLYGHCADMAAIGEIAARRSLAVIEDAAQAHGATYRGRRAGSFGDLGCFSFYPSKNLGACGDGGMVTTDRRDLAERVAMLRNCGARIKYLHDEVGLNSRLDTLQAAILRRKLRRLDEWNEARRRIAREYDAALRRLVGIDRPPLIAGSVYHLYVVRLAGRDAVLDVLAARGIGAGVHYPFAVHELGACASLGYRTGDFPVAEDWARRGLSLPIYPELAADAVEFCVEAIEAALAPARHRQC
jgi:dTDP-4-amino-4,6-dideoxygalactose transaminase